ncbi:hypothetical protein [Escherichia marmotae]|uniref:hypothetical protein n=1 Tax=Escherichia marmotae TaxID=1499973 RepID=UPI002FE1A965
MNTITRERLTKILIETMALIKERSSRTGDASGISTEVNAELFAEVTRMALERILDAAEYQECRAAMLQGSQPVSNRDELPESEIECDICGFKSTDPDGAHYCCEDNSND